MGNTWIVDMRHYLDEETGDLPESLPTPVLNLALFFGSIVAWVTDHLPEGDWPRRRWAADMGQERPGAVLPGARRYSDDRVRGARHHLEGAIAGAADRR